MCGLYVYIYIYTLYMFVFTTQQNLIDFVNFLSFWTITISFFNPLWYFFSAVFSIGLYIQYVKENIKKWYPNQNEKISKFCWMILLKNIFRFFRYIFLPCDIQVNVLKIWYLQSWSKSCYLNAKKNSQVTQYL